MRSAMQTTTATTSPNRTHGNYTVRNITTSDEEDIRVLELTDEELARFPEPVREEVHRIVADNAERFRVGWQPGDNEHWLNDQDILLRMLLPWISDRALYDSDYGRWEARLLGDDARLLDSLPPETIADNVRTALTTLVEAAVENWAEGYWADVPPTLTHGEAFDMLAGFVDSMRDMEDGPLDEPVFEQLPADENA